MGFIQFLKKVYYKFSAHLPDVKIAVGFSFAVVTLTCCMPAMAHDFEVDGICYLKTSDRTVAVSFRGDHYYSYIHNYVGDIVIPASVTYGGVSYSVTSIGDYAFYVSDGMTSVKIPESIESIGRCAFYSCTGLKSVVLPDSLTYLGVGAFIDCTGLESVRLPEYIVSISDSAFKNCSSLRSAVIPNSVVEMGDYVFERCYSLSSVTFGTGLRSIGIWSGLKEGWGDEPDNPDKAIWLPNTPPAGYEAVKARVNYVSNDSYVFKTLTRFTYDHLSSMFDVGGVVYVPVSPSERTCDIIDCTYSESVNEIHLGRTVSFNGVQLSVLNIRPYAFCDNDNIRTLTIDRDGDIAGFAFYDCDNISSLSLPPSIGSVGDYCFYSCDAMGALNLRNSGSVGNYAFGGCVSLPEIDIRSVGSVGDGAFARCSSATSLRVAPTVTKIGKNAFGGCTSLESVYFEDWLEPQADLNISEDAVLRLESASGAPMFDSCPLVNVYIGRVLSYSAEEKHGYSPFYRNLTLKRVEISDVETDVSDYEFYGCSGLTSVSIGDGVVSFGKYAFSGCTRLESFEFGKSVKSIGEEAFSDCSGMTSLTCHNPEPPVCGKEALDDINKWKCTLYVPEDSFDKYRTAPQWKEFFFIGEAGIEAVDAGEMTPLFIVTPGGVCLSGAVGEHIRIYSVSGLKVFEDECYAGGDVALANGAYIICVGAQSFKVKL